MIIIYTILESSSFHFLFHYPSIILEILFASEPRNYQNDEKPGVCKRPRQLMLRSSMVIDFCQKGPPARLHLDDCVTRLEHLRQSSFDMHSTQRSLRMWILPQTLACRVVHLGLLAANPSDWAQPCHTRRCRT